MKNCIHLKRKQRSIKAKKVKARKMLSLRRYKKKSRDSSILRINLLKRV